MCVRANCIPLEGSAPASILLSCSLNLAQEQVTTAAGRNGTLAHVTSRAFWRRGGMLAAVVVAVAAAADDDNDDDEDNLWIVRTIRSTRS